jgi:cytidylate kinase
MDSSILHDARISAAAERQMRTWVRVQDMAARAANHGSFDASAAQGICYVTISREAGAGGATVARLVGERLGWEVYDGNLLDQVAQRYKESRLMLDLVDETESSWVYDVLGTWMDRKIIPHEKYAVQIGRMIQVLAKAGNAVFVGRGAQFLLPRAKTFAARIVASEGYRAQRVRQRQNLGLSEAMVWIHHTDRGRHESIRRVFRRDINDPHLYDIVINVERSGTTGAADQIVSAMKIMSHAAP